MSPVCRKCHNYILSFPCPHCGTEESLDDRTVADFKPIVPAEVQATFDEPPAPITKAHSVSDSAKEELTEPSIAPPSSEPARNDSPGPLPSPDAKVSESSVVPQEAPAPPSPDVPMAKAPEASMTPQEAPAPPSPDVPVAKISKPIVIPQEAPAPQPAPAIKPSRRSLDFKSGAVGAAAAVATIEDHLRKMQNSIQRLEESVHAILQGQNGMQAILEEMRKEKEEKKKKKKKKKWRKKKEKNKEKAKENEKTKEKDKK
ncbi:MAG: hypothetical protein ACFFGZ_14350 [Candidatus Thorarchaeota archaeon]